MTTFRSKKTFFIALTLFAFGSQANPPELKHANITLLPHQLIPIQHMLNNPGQKGIVVDHYMGTGKTFAGIALAEIYPDRPVIVIAHRFLESHWREQIKLFGVKSPSRFHFYSYQSAARKLPEQQIRQSVVVIDEAHNFVKLIQTSVPEEARHYLELYAKLKQAPRIVALTATPVHSKLSDVSFLTNLVAGKDVLPYNEESFRAEYTKVIPGKSFWRGHLLENPFLLVPFVPLVVGWAAMTIVASPFILIPGLVIGGAIIPLTNSLMPISSYPLREIDSEKLGPLIKPYISFYKPQEKLAAFPSVNLNVKEISYNKPQLDFFMQYAQEDLNPNDLRRLLPDYDLENDAPLADIGSSALQAKIAPIFGNGREIGNLSFTAIDGKLVEPPKFLEILDLLQKRPGKAVVYSSYHHNGILAFADFLKRHGEDSFKILHPDMSENEIGRIVHDYNQGKFRILLLHKELTEGLSLNGTRQFYILEPLPSSTTTEQLIARAVRYESHKDLPEAERHVDVYLFVTKINSLQLSTILKRKTHWVKYNREFTDFSFGAGLNQVDSHHERKRYSPDTYAYFMYTNLKGKFNELDEMWRKHSIEKFSPELAIDRIP